MEAVSSRGSLVVTLVLTLILSHRYLLVHTLSTAGCDQPWYREVSKDLTVSWSGDDRDGTVEVTATTEDAFDPPCNSNETLKTAFKERTLKVQNPCSDALYKITITLTCGEAVDRHEMTLQTPPVPSPPQNVTITALGTDRIGLEWSEPIPDTGPILWYDVRWVETEDESSASSNRTYNNSIVILALHPFTEYFIEVTATTAIGTGPPANITVKTRLAVPDPPTPNYQATNISIFVSWEPACCYRGPDRNYSLQYRAKKESNPFEVIDFDEFETLNHTIAGLRPFTVYEVQVRARNRAGNGPWSEILEVETLIGNPSEPLNLTDVKVTNTSILVNWQPPQHKNGPVLTYVIRWTPLLNVSDEKDDSITTSFGSPREQEVDVTEHEIADLDPYANYSVRVCAKTSAGMGNYTEALLLQTRPGIPGAPSSLQATSVGSTSLTLRWRAPERTNGPLQAYDVHWGVRETGGSRSRTHYTVYSALGLRPYTEYFFRVAAETVGGTGVYVAIYERTAISTPSEPRDLVFSDVTDRSILLEWSPPEHPNAPAIRYTLQWRKITDQPTTQVQETNSSQFRMDDLAAGTNYSVRVCAETPVGKGPWTEVLYVKTNEKDPLSAVIAGSVVGGLVVLCVVVGAVVLLVAKRRGGLKNIMPSKTRSTVPVTSSETVQSNVSLKMAVLDDTECPNIRNFDQRVLQLTENGYHRLSQEFQKLGRESPALASDCAKRSENLIKNRWIKILPFDHSRVKLLSVGEETEPDFINASYIPGDSYLLEYIATQGPLPNTLNDFWLMVWQQSVFLIVTLTQCVERAKKTCERYWPSQGETVKYGQVDVQTISESSTSSYIIRLMLVSQGGQQRHVVQLHYHNWPVSGCPKSPDDFLAFVRTVRGQMTRSVTGPTLVHCSAGIGRTGTFIAVDRLWRQLDRRLEEVDVYGTVLDMRRYRSNMVQTEEQYYFIHLCLQRIIQENRMELENDYGEGIYSN